LVPKHTGSIADLPVMSGTSNPPDIILDMDITGPSIKISFMNIIIDTDLTGITINTNISDFKDYSEEVMV
jgi:hypothetical protein